MCGSYRRSGDLKCVRNFLIFSQDHSMKSPGWNLKLGFVTTSPLTRNNPARDITLAQKVVGAIFKSIKLTSNLSPKPRIDAEKPVVFALRRDNLRKRFNAIFVFLIENALL